MLVKDVDFIKAPSVYLSKVETESIIITKEGRTIAVLAKPNATPIADSLLGLLKGAGITSAEDIKAMKVNI